MAWLEAVEAGRTGSQVRLHVHAALLVWTTILLVAASLAI